MDDQEPEHKPTSNQNNTKNVVVTIIVIIGLLIGIGVWWNNTHYNSTFQNNFMSKCESGGSSTATSCGCAYGVLMANYSYSQAKQMDADATAGISSPDLTAWTASVQSQCGSSQSQ